MKYAFIASATCFAALGLIFQIAALGIPALVLFLFYTIADTDDLIKGGKL